MVFRINNPPIVASNPQMRHSTIVEESTGSVAPMSHSEVSMS